ncbi:hypothetical protein BJX62DRAFT_240128 [Aspergillus germanicus]
MTAWKQRMAHYRLESDVTRGELQLLECARLILPEIERAAIRVRDGLQPKSAFQSGRAWVRDYINRKSQLSFVVSPAEYRAARLKLLEKEKEATRQKDALAAERRKLPMVELSKPYSFETIPEDGGELTKSLTLSDLFDGRRQLIVYHFMFDPAWDEGCMGCTVMGDSFPTALEHIHSRSTTVVAVSRAPIEKIAAYKKRMGWSFPWVSSYHSNFNYDMHVTQDDTVQPIEYSFRNKQELEHISKGFHAVGEQPGTSVFYRGDGMLGEEGKIYHTYSTYVRGGEHLINTFGWLDLTLLGRQDGESGVGGIGFHRREEYTADELRGLH